MNYYDILSIWEKAEHYEEVAKHSWRNIIINNFWVFLTYMTKHIEKSSIDTLRMFGSLDWKVAFL